MTDQQNYTAATAPELVRLVNDSLQAKTLGDVDAFMSYFSVKNTVYIDPTLRLFLDGWERARGALAQLVPTWASGVRSYATKIIGDENSAIVFMVDSKEMFGAEIRTVSPVDFKDGKITRWVDYWSGRNWPQGHLENIRFPAEQFPDDLKESSVGERATSAIRQTSDALATAFSANDAAAVVQLITPDAEFDDFGLHVHLIGSQAIGFFLEKTLRLLPYGRGLTVRHVVGGDAGGGFEWTAGPDTNRPGLPGVTALELDGDGRIFRITSAWNAEAIADEELVEMYRHTFSG